MNFFPNDWFYFSEEVYCIQSYPVSPQAGPVELLFLEKRQNGRSPQRGT
jgi:hypothetical protein